MGWGSCKRPAKFYDTQIETALDDIDVYYRNAQTGMTKERYYELKKQLNQEVVESEVPIDFSDLMETVQEYIILFNYLPDKYEGMSGTYMGKDYACLKIFMDILKIEDGKLALLFLNKLDGIRMKELNRKKSSSKK